MPQIKPRYTSPLMALFCWLWCQLIYLFLTHITENRIKWRRKSYKMNFTQKFATFIYICWQLYKKDSMPVYIYCTAQYQHSYPPIKNSTNRIKCDSSYSYHNLFSLLFYIYLQYTSYVFACIWCVVASLIAIIVVEIILVPRNI